MVKASTLDRATRECLTSPTMAMRRPPSGPRSFSIVKQSRRAWVGCSCQPSPALITEQSTQEATCQGTPADEWRTTRASTPMASMVCTVSRRDSPLLTDEVDTEKFMVSADSRLAAASNDSRVRVDSSKKSDTTVLPRRAGTLGMARSLTSTNESLTRSTSSIPSAPRSATDSRCTGGPVTGASPPRRHRRRARRPPRRAGWGGSCPRSRGGWAAPGGPGRPSPPAAPPGAARSR